MMATKPMSVPAHSDTDLVQASLAGNRDAFGQIVARYQSLICALAYSATGNLNRSEDLAQDTFVAAWQQLSALREPSKLRAWLCGIARHLISNAQRRAGREPAHLAEPFDPAHEAVATEASPPEQAVTREEEAILWRALGKIPETYREPLVLYYRDHQSVEAVARELGLSEDAVKQRLSRGRALLHGQVLALIEGTLARSNPGRAFTLGVMTALPAMSGGLAAAAGVATTTKGAAGAKGATWIGPLGTVLTAQVLWFASSVAFVASLGGFAGWQMNDPAQSPAERRWAAWFWRLFAVGMLAWVLPKSQFENLARAHPTYAGALATWLSLFYLVVGVPLVLWAIANHRRIRGTQAVAETAGPATERVHRAWVAAPTFILAALFVAGLFQARWDERVRPDEVGKLIAAHPSAQLTVEESAGGRWIAIAVTDDRKTRLYRGPLNAPTFRQLQQSGRRFETRRQGRDYDVLGWPARRLPLVTILSFGAGAMFLLRDRLARRAMAPTSPRL